MNLDFMPSPAPDHPGLFIRDPYSYSDAMLIIPPVLVECLQCFDGRQTDLDLRATLVRITNDLEVGEIQQHLVQTLSDAGFLEDESLRRMQQSAGSEFAAAPVREPAHAGSAYPGGAGALRETMAKYMAGAGNPRADGLFAIAAPHVSPEGGWQSYRAAYSVLGAEASRPHLRHPGTSHYGEPERFGLTRKSFAHPARRSVDGPRLVDWLAARGGARSQMEDYCHSVEHSIEFQVVFLQHMLGPGVRILPILCGSYARSIYAGRRSPRTTTSVQRFFGRARRTAATAKATACCWVLGVDMAHMGARYGDQFQRVAERGADGEVRSRDERASSASMPATPPDSGTWCGRITTI